MAFGKRNTVNRNPLAYQIMLLGEPKVGKTTLIKQVCEKLVGPDGYLFVELGSERGADAIEGINYINCPVAIQDYQERDNSAGFLNVVEDIVENKDLEYPNLKVLVLDTIDQEIPIIEQEVIRRYNRIQKDRDLAPVKTINEAYGGFGRGEKEAMKLMQNIINRLASVGVSTIRIGHVKRKEITDVTTGASYQMLTSDQQSNYFNDIKKSVHIMALAYVDRDIEKVDPTKAKSASVVKGETRRIKFRDDNYVIDAGSRFSKIVGEIPMDADAFIKAIEDAIAAEAGTSEETPRFNLKKQTKAKPKQEEEDDVPFDSDEVPEIRKSTVQEDIKTIMTWFQENKSDKAKWQPIWDAIKDMGYDSPRDLKKKEKTEAILLLIG